MSRGNLVSYVVSVFMKLFYVVRIARFDLLRFINVLVRNVIKWIKDDDVRFYYLMCYVNFILFFKMIGWVGDKIEDLLLGLFVDADFVGCV